MIIHITILKKSNPKKQKTKSKTDAGKLEGEIDERVFELYGLGEEEIGMMKEF